MNKVQKLIEKAPAPSAISEPPSKKFKIDDDKRFIANNIDSTGFCYILGGWKQNIVVVGTLDEKNI